MFLPIENIYDADLIRQDNNGCIYLCYLNPELSTDKKRQTDIEDQNCWRIVKISQIEDNGVTYTFRKYPNGDAYNYNYAPTDIDNYTFDFRR